MAKFSFISVLAIPLVPVAMFACGGDDGPTIVRPDSSTGSGSNGSGSGSASVCNAKADYGTLTTYSKPQTAKYTAGSGSDVSNDITWTGAISGSDAVRLIIFAGCGSASGQPNCPSPTPDWPTTFVPKSGVDLAAADVLFLVLANPNSAVTPPRYDDIYLATAGTLNVTAASNGSGQPFMATAVNVETVHIDTSGSTIMEHPDGCKSNAASVSMMATTTAIGKPIVVYGSDDRYDGLRQYLAHRRY